MHPLTQATKIGTSPLAKVTQVGASPLTRVIIVKGSETGDEGILKLRYSGRTIISIYWMRIVPLVRGAPPKNAPRLQCTPSNSFYDKLKLMTVLESQDLVNHPPKIPY